MYACFQCPTHILQNKTQRVKRCHPHGLQVFSPQLTLLEKSYQRSIWCRQFLIETVFPNESRLYQGAILPYQRSSHKDSTSTALPWEIFNQDRWLFSFPPFLRLFSHLYHFFKHKKRKKKSSQNSFISLEEQETSLLVLLQLSLY